MISVIIPLVAFTSPLNFTRESVGRTLHHMRARACGKRLRFHDTKLKPTRFNLSAQPRPTDVTSSCTRAISPRLKSGRYRGARCRVRKHTLSAHRYFYEAQFVPLYGLRTVVPGVSRIGAFEARGRQVHLCISRPSSINIHRSLSRSLPGARALGGGSPRR